MQATEGTEHKRNYYALYLAIKKDMTPSKAMNEMGISNYSRNVENENNKQEKQTKKEKLFEKNKKDILQMRRNGATYKEIAKKYDFYSWTMFAKKLKSIKKGATA